MKIEVLENKNFYDIGTVVFYTIDKYIPDIPSPEIYNNLLEENISYRYIFRSSEISSDFLDFAEYNFQFKIDKDKIKSFVLGNYYDSITRSNLLINKYSLSIFDKLFPQFSDEESTVPNYRYFGSIDFLNSVIILLDIPENISRIEIYSEYIESNNNEVPGSFIPYEILNKLNITTNVISPIASIDFGPTKEVINNPSSFYYPNETYQRNISLPKKEYFDLQQEIYGRKLLYLTISPEKFLKEINLSYLGWSSSKNPNRNLINYSVKEGDTGFIYTSTRNLTSNIKLDRNTGYLLGTNKLDEIPPILASKITQSKSIYSKTSRFSEKESVYLNNNEYISLIDNNIGEVNLDTSKFWKIQNPLELPKSSKYFNFFCYSENHSRGEVFPSGSLIKKIGENFIFQVKEKFGYKLHQILSNKGFSIPFTVLNKGIIQILSSDLEGTLVLRFIFQEMTPEVNISVKFDNLIFNKDNLPEGLSLEILPEILVYNESLTVTLQDLLNKFKVDKILIDGVQSSLVGNIISQDHIDFYYREYQYEISSRQFECKVIEYLGGEVDKIGGFTEYGSNFELVFYPKLGNSYSSVSISGNYSDSTVSSLGGGLYKLLVTNITSNCEITIIFI